MVIASRYVEIAADLVIVPIKLGDNEKCLFFGSNHFLVLVKFLNYTKSWLWCVCKGRVSLLISLMLFPQDNFTKQIYHYEIHF